MGEITFPFTIRNQYTSSFATIRAAVENKNLLYRYHQDFFSSAMSLSSKSQVKGYVFGDTADKNRTKAFIDKLLIHKIKVYELNQKVTKKGVSYSPGSAYVVPTHQEQYRMVQTMFETYDKYIDSVFYDASAWSVANFYNMPYSNYTGSIPMGKEITIENNRVSTASFPSSNYAYLVPYNDYNAVPVLYQLLKQKVRVTAAFKPFSLDGKQYGYGTLMVPVSKQTVSKDRLYDILKKAGKQWKVDVIPVATGFSASGIDLGSRYFLPVQKPKVLLWIGEGTSSYEAGEVWHLLDTRMHMPVTKARLHQFSQVRLDKYNAMVMISGSYNRLDSLKRQRNQRLGICRQYAYHHTERLQVGYRKGVG